MPLRFGQNTEPSTPPAAISTTPTTLPRPRIGEYGPRVVRETKTCRITTLIFGGLVLFEALAGAAILTKLGEDRQTLLRDGQQVTATITDMERSGDKRYVDYRYTWNGRTVSDREKVGRNFYREHSAGDRFLITLSRSNPELRRFGTFDAEAARGEAMEGILVAFLTVLTTGIGLIAIRGTARRDTRVLTDWPAATALITESKSTSGKNGTTFRIAYRFSVRGFPDTEKKTTYSNATKWKPEVGGTVDVLYDPENPQKSFLLPQLTMAEIDDGGIR